MYVNYACRVIKKKIYSISVKVTLSIYFRNCKFNHVSLKKMRIGAKNRDIERSTAPATTCTIPRGEWRTPDTDDYCRQDTEMVRMK